MAANPVTKHARQVDMAFWPQAADCHPEDLVHCVERRTSVESCPHAARIEREVPIYDGGALREWARDTDARRAVMAEWGWVLMDGPGVIVLQGAFDDLETLDRATRRFTTLIEAQHASGQGGGDHFAKPGANDRIWNALQKHCLQDPEGFARYYANPLVAMACEAWLGPGYQMTAQVNVVNPGGEAQSPHRDYHLGFMPGAAAARFPAPVHRLSPFMTLQGAVAHVDMPVESGPTLYLPYSQTYAPGYLAVGLPAFRDLFIERHVQLPLSKGDVVFFNPALMHAAGHNRTSHVRRMANLLQVSSAFGRAMESVDRLRMSLALYPALQSMRAAGSLSDEACDHAIAACAEGYAFPTNLDLDPPLGGLAPASPQVVMRQALHEGWDVGRFRHTLETLRQRREA